MKKQTILFIGIIWWNLGYGQTLTPQVFAATGDYYANTSGSLSWTLGESVIETYSSVNNFLTQGFQQSSYNVTSVDEIKNDALSVSVYPNPTSGFINIQSESTGNKKLKVELLDVTGKLIHSEIFQNNLQLNLSNYSNSEYFIRVYDENNNAVKTFKLLKTN